MIDLNEIRFRMIIHDEIRAISTEEAQMAARERSEVDR